MSLHRKVRNEKISREEKVGRSIALEQSRNQAEFPPEQLGRHNKSQLANGT